MWSEFFNVKVEDLITIIDKSIEAGHTVLWAADVSEEGFDQARGYAVLPGINPSGMSKKDIEAYKAKTPDQQKLISRRLSSPGIEMNVTYHFMITVTDKAGFSVFKSVEIEIKEK